MKKAALWMLLLALCLLAPGAMAEEEKIDVDLSLESGFYADVMELEITCNADDVTLFYTTDGTAPDDTAIPYEGPISLSSTVNKPDLLAKNLDTNKEETRFVPWVDFPSAHVIRAAAVDGDGQVVDTAAGTFFIGIDRAEHYGDLPIINLIMDEKDLFDYDTGIYVLGATHDEWDSQQEEPYEAWQAEGNYSNRGREWERPVAVDFLMPEGESFSQNMGVRIKGGTSRTAPQKSLRLIARDEYGKKSVKYPLFPDNLNEETGEIQDKYKSITLRNGGNDRDNTKIRDPFISRLSEGLELEVAATRPVIGFINGEYWGIYTLTEEFNDNYLQHHYGIDNENVVLIKNGELKDGDEDLGDEDLFWEMFDFILYEDMSDPEMYAQAAEMLDMKSFADQVAVDLYIYNTDGVFYNNNWLMWCVRDTELSDHALADGKWRMMLFDTDLSSDVYGNGGAYSEDNVSEYLQYKNYEEWELGALVLKLLENEEFKKELALSMADVRNMFFNKTRTKALLNEMNEQYSPYMDDTFLRFGPYWVAEWNLKTHYKEKIKSMRNFFDGRYGCFMEIAQRSMGFDAPANVNIKISDSEKGSVILNHRDTMAFSETLETKQFPNYPFTVTAVPKEGATFVCWEVNNDRYATIADPTALTTEVTFNSSFAITAVFE